ncbi:MAG: outer membrane lipid asymmetry maintenance protein MlaD [Rhodospirillales bacterium RIFCSPLOWO2_12_FULL_58_28]|nr:MAG: outer membrane lipid asymmetry maintenance protein MlaD [Rhodospirillales bacterium RIFCSPLOWO2_12_FULL_58_28]
MGRNAVETVLGAVVLLAAAVFVQFAYSTAEVKAVEGYGISAVFYKIGGLSKGSDVRINGIKVGTVVGNSLNPENYDAVVKMTITPEIKLPTDTVAIIASEGMMGDKYVRLEPGSAKTYVASGGRIAKTKDFRSLEDQVGEIIFLATGGDGNGNGGDK